jgi:hypothetical protein
LRVGVLRHALTTCRYSDKARAYELFWGGGDVDPQKRHCHVREFYLSTASALGDRMVENQRLRELAMWQIPSKIAYSWPV